MSKTWCEHMDGHEKFKFLNLQHHGGEIRGFGNGLVKFCPICGTPRPKEKSLAERLKEAYNTAHNHYWNQAQAGNYPTYMLPPGTSDQVRDWCNKETWEAVAKEAERYFNERA